MEKPVTRWIVEISHKRYALIDDIDELEGWEDEVLEIKLPASAAAMLDATMRAYYNAQAYMDAQWEIAGKRAAEQAAVEAKALTNQSFYKILIDNKMVEEPEPPKEGGAGKDIDI